ncbi:PadR family transcriptional regulator [Parafrankia soli]|uniref:PadR family transcriptional regulator n=1 Tax=Parafrankia soli TaxID=2599596 RepID=A0A1S1PP28_9ACTN|nr:PadR family transcriptional regulator [Parafrankia soli]OHV22492.1 PadR family transcriptional regulator [Parafrankia soli]
MSSHAMPGWDARWDTWGRYLPFDPTRLLDPARLLALAEAARGSCRPGEHSHVHGEHRGHAHGEHRSHMHGDHGPGEHGGDHGPGPRGRGGRGGRGGRPGGPFGPGGFGPGGWPFGRGFPPGPGFGRGARVARGDVREALLALLAEEPMHGYQMIGELASRSGGVWRPSPGSVYPVLSLLADEGLVRAEERDGRRVFHLTDAGRAHVEARAGTAKPWETAAASADDETTALRTLAFGVGAAVVQVAQAGDADQIAAARDLLTETRRGLYRILAGDLTDSPAAGPAEDGGAGSGPAGTAGATDPGPAGGGASAPGGQPKDLG